MADPITIFRKTTGLNTLIDPANLNINEGVQELAVAADVEISDNGRLSRRKGYTSVNSTTNLHSIFCSGGDCICVGGTNLYLVGTDYNLTSIATVTENAKLNACQVNDRIYWVNGYEKGYVQAGTNYNWVKGTYVGPVSKRVLIDPPIGNLIEFYNGRIYITQGNALWFSEPFNYHAFDSARGVIPFADTIQMIAAVDDGLFVSTTKEVFFISGDQPNDFKLVVKNNYPAISGTEAKFIGRLVFDQDGNFSIAKSGMKSVIWLSEAGINYGSSGGQFKNLTEDKIEKLVFGLSGSGIVFNGKYIGLINP